MQNGYEESETSVYPLDFFMNTWLNNVRSTFYDNIFSSICHYCRNIIYLKRLVFKWDKLSYNSNWKIELLHKSDRRKNVASSIYITVRLGENG